MDNTGKPTKRGIIATIIVLSLMGLAYAYTPTKTNRDEYPPQPPYVTAKTCPEILLQLDDAISAWAIAQNQSNTNRPTAAMLGDYFKVGKIPVCPQGGTIVLGSRALATTCSLHGMADDKRPVPNQRKRGLLESYLPFLYPPRSTYPCIVNLKMMDGAAQQWALENKKTDSDVVDALATAQYLKLGQLPTCPAGGKYQFSYVSNPPVCTRATNLGHSLP